MKGGIQWLNGNFVGTVELSSSSLNATIHGNGQ
jgi:hypothetical protein